MRGVFLGILVFCSFQIVSAQKDTINQTNDQGLRIGYWVGYYPDGTIRYEARFTDGKLIGEMKRYYPNGSIKAILLAKSVQDPVSARLYDNNNHVRAAGYYKNQIKIGEWRFYNTREELILSVSYNNDSLDGLAYRFYNNGIIQEKTQWKDNKLNGLQSIYNQRGDLEAEIHYIEGKMEGSYNVYFPNHTIEITGQYSSNVKTGLWQYYKPGGSLNYKLKYNNGILLNPEVLTKEQEQNFKEYEKNRTLLKDPLDYMQDPVGYFKN